MVERKKIGTFQTSRRNEEKKCPLTRREKSEKVRAAGIIKGGKEGNERKGNERGNKRRGKGRE